MAVVGAETHQTLSGVATGDSSLFEEALGLREAQLERTDWIRGLRAGEDRRPDRARCAAGVLRLAGRERAQ